MPRRTIPFTEYGLSVRKTLLEINKTPTWLAEIVSERGDCFMDAPYLNKILTGKVKAVKKVDLINQILTEERGKLHEQN